MIYFKACLKCKGDVHLNIRDRVLKCLACGFTIEGKDNPYSESLRAIDLDITAPLSGMPQFIDVNE